MADYQRALVERAAAQQRHAAHRAAGRCGDHAGLARPGAGLAGDVPGQPLAPRPTGDFVFNAPSSMLFAPAVTMPLMAVGGMPVGVQVMGQRGEDAAATAIARWLLGRCEPVAM